MEEHMNVIHITTLNDPSLFWFLYEKDIPNRSKLGEELKKKYNDSSFTIYTNVEIEEKVLVNYSDEWLRAEVVFIKKINSIKNEFICWLLDYGIFIEVKNVYKMPDLFKDIPPYAKKAKVYGLISVYQEYDFISGKMQENILKTWNPGVQEGLKEFLNKPGVTQYFTEKYSFNGFCYGTIYIKIINEGIFDLKDKIIASGFGKYDEELFSSGLLRNDVIELSLQDVYRKAINLTGNRTLTQHNCLNLDETDGNFSLNLKNEPNKQSSPIVTCGRGKHRLSSSSNKGSSDSESSILKESANNIDTNLKFNSSHYKSKGRGFSKVNREENRNPSVNAIEVDKSLQNKSTKESSDSESSGLNSGPYKLRGRGFSKKYKEENRNPGIDEIEIVNSQENKSYKESSYSESSVLKESLNRSNTECKISNADEIKEKSILKESISNSSLICTKNESNNSRYESIGRGFSKINEEVKNTGNIDNFDDIGVAGIVKKKSSGRGFTKSLQPQMKKDPIKVESDESKFVDYETDWPGEGGSKKILDSSRSSANSSNRSKENISSETESSSVGSFKSARKSVFHREKVANVIAGCPAGSQLFHKTTSKKSVSDDDQSQNFHDVPHPKRPPQKQLGKSNGEESGFDSGSANNHSLNNQDFDWDNAFCKDEEEPTKIICPPGQCDCDICVKTFDSRIVFEPYVEEKRVPIQRRQINVPLLFKKRGDENRRVVIKNQKKEFMSVTENLLAPRILVHSKFIIHPADDLYTVPFHPEVQQMLRILRYEKPTRVQQYAWPSIMRGQHVFLIGPKGTGKTMAYIPAICTFILTDIPDLPNVNGPLAIIICPGVKVAENIYKIINKLINPKKNKKICLVVPPFKNKHKSEISKGVDVLICSPKTLILLLKEKLISLKRLLYVVLENSKFLFDIFYAEIEAIFKIFEKNLIIRKFGQSIQLIVISQHWSKSIEFLAKNLNNTPSICIGAYLEAALYGRADIKIQVVETCDKPYKIIDILANQSKVYKSVVVYNEVSEIKEALKYLDTHGIDYEFLDGSEPVEHKRAVNRRWFNSTSGQHFVLVCNDDVLNTDLAITDAFIFIQYSLPPDSWSQFVYRFSSFLDNYTSPLIENDGRLPKCKMHIFIDGTNTEQFPRIVQFLQRMNCKLSDNILKSYNVLVENIEENKRKNNLGLCYNLLLFGSCPDIITVCKGRHYLCAEMDWQAGVPQSGIVKLRILHVVSPVTYFCRLLEHTDAENVAHKITNNYAFISTKLTKLMNSDERKLVLEANVGGMYIVEVAGTYERCKVTEITKKGVIQRASRVAVKLIDIGKKINVSTLDLYILPDYLRSIPAQAIEVTLSNLGPCDKDSAWSEKCHQIIETEIQNKIHDDDNSNCYFIGRIQLQLNNKLYVENLVLQEIVESKPVNVTVNKLNIRNTLFKYNLVENRPHILEKLYLLCEKFNMQLPDYTLPVLTIENNKFPQQVEPQWAHLENYEEYNEVFFAAAINPDQFFVKLSKNYNVLNQLRKDIEVAINKPFYPNEFPILEGNCYLVKDPEENSYERALLKKLNGNIAQCFFVDYGDEISVPISELKFLMDEHITQLPFQIIECKLYGIEPSGGDAWSSATTDILYDLAHEPDTDLFRFLYVKTMENEEPVHTGYKKYSVILIDNFDDNKIINNLFVDMNFAVKVCNEQFAIDMDKFKMKKDRNTDVESDSSSNNYNNNNQIETIQNNDDAVKDQDEDDIWDFQMFDSKTFIADLLQISKPSVLPALPEESKLNDTQNKPKETKHNNADNKFRKMKALPSVDYSTPNIVWQQTDNDIKLKIHVIGVTKYELNVIHKKALIFKAECNGKVYKLNMRLYAPVATNLKHYIQGFHVVVNIAKANAENWPRLLLTTDRMPHITYNIDAIHVEDSDEDGLPSEEMIRNSKEAAKSDDDGSFKYVFGSDEDYDESDFDSYQSSD